MKKIIYYTFPYVLYSFLSLTGMESVFKIDNSPSLFFPEINQSQTMQEPHFPFLEYIHQQALCEDTFQNGVNIKKLKKDMKHLIKNFSLSLDNISLWQRPVINTQSTSFYYVEKILIKPTQKLYVYGDIHGNISALEDYLRELQRQGAILQNNIVSPDAYVIFLGDYIDRGPNNLEVIDSIVRLKIKNSHNVILIRGNHDHPNLYRKFNSYTEIADKLYDQNISEERFFPLLDTFFMTLPSAVYVQSSDNPTQSILFAHGSHDPSHDNLLSFLQNPQFTFDSCNEFSFQHLQNSQNTTTPYAWNDYTDENPLKTTASPNNRREHCLMHHKEETKDWMITNNILAIFHGHAHVYSQPVSPQDPFVWGLPCTPNFVDQNTFVTISISPFQVQTIKFN